MASSLPEYRIYMDFVAAQNAGNDSTLMNHLTEICEGLHQIFPDKSAKEFRRHILNGRKKEKPELPALSETDLIHRIQGSEEAARIQPEQEQGRLPRTGIQPAEKAFRLAGRTHARRRVCRCHHGSKNGLELTYDSILRGKDGAMHRQKVRGTYVDIVDVPPVDGCDIITTIDVDMQDIAEKALVDQLKNLNAQSGVAIVMEVATGKVRANVNMRRGNDGSYYEMRNDAVSNLMEPGSTFKTASIMVALEDGYITPDYVVDTGNGIVNMHGSNMKDWNWHHGGYGKIDVTHILGYSSNVGVSTIIDRFYGNNPQKFIDGLRRMSIDKPLNLGFVGEASPRIRGPKERSYFAKTTLPWMSIGYETMFPPIYLLNFYNAIANNGVMVKPKFVEAISKDGEIIKEYPTEIVNPKICSDKTLEQIRTMLQKVVAEGLAKQAGSKQFHVSGKTGTAQISQEPKGIKAERPNISSASAASSLRKTLSTAALYLSKIPADILREAYRQEVCSAASPNGSTPNICILT